MTTTFKYNGHGQVEPLSNYAVYASTLVLSKTIEVFDWEMFKELKFFQSQNHIPVMNSYPEYMDYRLAFARYVRSVVDIIRKYTEKTQLGSDGHVYNKFGMVWDIHENVEIHFRFLNDSSDYFVVLQKALPKEEAKNESAA